MEHIRVTHFVGSIDCRPVPRYKLRHETRYVCCEVDNRYKARQEKPCSDIGLSEYRNGPYFYSIKPIQTQEWSFPRGVSSLYHTLTIHGQHKAVIQLTVTTMPTTKILGLVGRAPASYLGCPRCISLPEATAVLTEFLVVFSALPDKRQTTECQLRSPLLSSSDSLFSNHSNI